MLVVLRKLRGPKARVVLRLGQPDSLQRAAAHNYTSQEEADLSSMVMQEQQFFALLLDLRCMNSKCYHYLRLDCG